MKHSQLLRIVYYLCLILFFALPMKIFAQEAPSESEKFRIALTGKYPPFSFYDQDGELTGFDVDVSREIATRIELELEIITTEWDGILAGLLGGRFDAIIGSMAITPEREKSVNFSDPYYISGAQLFVAADDIDTITGIDDLTEMNVGVVLGTTYENYLTEKYPDINVKTYKGDVDIFQDMRNERLDGFVTDKLVGMFQIKKAGLPFLPTGELLYDEYMGIPVVKERPELLQDINMALAEMEKEGVFEELHAKWFVSEMDEASSEEGEVTASAMSTATVAKKLGRGFIITLFVAFLSLGIGFFIAIPCGVVLNGPDGIYKYILRAAVDFIRGTPVLIQLFFIYFGAPQVNITLSPIQCAILTLSINSAAYMAEVIRSGLMAVDPGQKVAGRALGLSPFQTFRYIVWPQAFRIATPPLMNSAVALLKDTALISVISVSEVIKEAQSIISVTYDPMTYYFIVAVMFFLFTFPLMKLAGYLENVMKRKGFKGA